MKTATWVVEELIAHVAIYLWRQEAIAAMSKLLRRILSIALAATVSAGVVIIPSWFGEQAALAQRVRLEGIYQQIYQQLPDLPRENQYINTETGKADPDNTLVGRLIRYHVYTKGRSPLYRLDWKLTLADYLGVNESIEEGFYPSHGKLRKSPVEGDVTAVRALTRSQRAALVQALVTAFTPPARATQPAPAAATPAPAITPAPTPTPAAQPARGPGSAQLLQP